MASSPRKRAKRPGPLLEHATALGYFCMGFASLEDRIDYLIKALLQCTLDQHRVIVGSTGQISNRCDLAIKLLYASPAPNARWRENVEKLLNDVRSKLIPLRNRYIHDPWGFDPPSKTPIQFDRRISVKAAQAFAEKSLTPQTYPRRALKEIRDANRLAGRLCEAITRAGVQYQNWRTTGRFEDTRQRRTQLSKDPTARRLGASEAKRPPPRSSPKSAPKRSRKKG